MTEEQEETRSKQKEEVIDLLPKMAYHVGKVCKKVGISRGTFYNWKKEDENFDTATEEVFAYDVDDSEEKLRLLRQGLPRFDGEGKFIGWIEKPHFGALVKHLEAKAKDRGYGRQLQIDDRRTEFSPEMTDKELYDEMRQLDELFTEEENDD